MDEIIYTTPSEQLQKLKEQHLIIEDEAFATKALANFGYSNLIKSYREPYMFISDDKKIYRSGITFNRIYSLYFLDKTLRNAVMATMLDLEEYVKEAAANIISNDFGTHPEDYLKFRNYANKRKRKDRFSLAGVLKTMNNTLNTDKNPIHHYQETHGIVPPWILFKSVYFSTITNFIDQFKTAQKNKLVHKLYDLSDLKISEDAARLLMMDTLFTCQEYRNTAAHGGRIYNYNVHCTLHTEKIWGLDSNNTKSGFSQLLFLLDLLKYRKPYKYLQTILTDEVNRHCSHFPEDVTYLAQILNVDIERHHVVYISGRSKKYHNDPHCSGLANAREVLFEEAEKDGYLPCKRCCLYN